MAPRGPRGAISSCLCSRKAKTAAAGVEDALPNTQPSIIRPGNGLNNTELMVRMRRRCYKPSGYNTE